MVSSNPLKGVKLSKGTRALFQLNCQCLVGIATDHYSSDQLSLTAFDMTNCCNSLEIQATLSGMTF